MTNTLDTAPADTTTAGTAAAQPAPSAAARGVGSRKRRGSNAHEREADRTAEAILAGATNVARGLSRAPAASMHHQASVGRPLETGLRHQLESSFGADLGAVRIHTDGAANALAAGEQARAFAAGAHIWFRSGSFAPETIDGRRLLLHEVTHALQQTARAAAGGRIAARDVESSGPIQAEDDFDAFFARMNAAERWSNVATAHHNADSDFVREIAAELGFLVDPKAPSIRTLAGRVIEGDYDGQGERELSFLYDVLKAGQRFDAAASLVLVDETNKIRTLLYSKKVVSELSGTAEETLALIKSSPALKKSRARMLASTWAFLRNPYQETRLVGELHGRPLPPIEANRAPWNDMLRANERFNACAAFLGGADLWRARIQQAAQDAAPKRATDVIGLGLGRARVVNVLATKRLDEGKLGAAGGAIVKDVQRRAAWAADFWERARARSDNSIGLLRRIRAGEVDAEVRAGLRQKLTRPVLRKGVLEIETAARTFLAGGAPAGSADYETRTKALATASTSAFSTVLPELDRLLRNKRSDREAMLAISLLQQIELMGKTARRYIAAKDQSGFRDTRRAHYSDVVLEIRRFGIMYGIDDFEALTLDVLRSRAVADRVAQDAKVEPGGTADDARGAPAPTAKVKNPDDVLILAGSWSEPEKRPAFDRLEDDFRRGIVIRGVTVPIRVITNHYRMRFARAAIQYLNEGLATANDPGATYVVGDALKRAGVIARPRRWSVDDVRWVPFDGDRRMVAALIRQHPKTVQHVAPTLARRSGFDAASPVVNDLDIYPYPGVEAARETTPALASGVFTWSLPDIAGLLRGVTSSIATFSRAGEITSGTSLGEQLDAAAAWLNQGSETEQRARLLELQNHMYAESSSLTESAYEQLGIGARDGGVLRLATNHDRSILRTSVSNHLKAYANGHKVAEWTHPSAAMQEITAFGRYALPREDGIAQMVALILEVSKDLNDAFLKENWFDRWLDLGPREEKRFDLVTGYWGLVAMTRAWANDPAKRAQLRDRGGSSRAHAILDKRDDWIRTTSRKELDPVATSFERTRTEMSQGQGFSLTPQGFRSPNYRSTVPLETELSVEVGPGRYEKWTVVKSRLVEFRYQPEWGADTGPRGAATSKQAAKVYIGKPAPGGEEVAAPKDTFLFEVRVNDERKESIAVGDPRLDALWRAVEDMAFVVSMQNLGQAIEDSISLALDLAEFVPGAGQALMVGRILASIAMFLGSADFDDIKAAVSGEMFEQIENIGDNLASLFAPEALIETMLFGDIGGLKALRGMASKKKGRPRKGALARLVKRVREIGPFLADQAEGLHQKVQLPLRNTQSYVQRNPPVAMVVVFAAQAIQIADQLPDIDGGWEQAKKDFSTKIEALVDTLAGIEVPKQIIEPQTFVEAIIGLILGRLGTKGKVVREILHMTGLMSEAAGLVTDALGNSLDGLNTTWQSKVQSKFAPVLNDARSDFIRALDTAFTAVGMDDLIQVDAKTLAVTSPDRVSLGVGATDDEPSESAPAVTQPTGQNLDLQTDSAKPDLLTPAVWSGGSSLPRDVRADVESRFGHDFGDVRLHTGPRSLAFTDPIGADALTAGSHVFVREGLSVRSGFGAGVLRHELTHVLQQRGPSPLGSPAVTPTGGVRSSSSDIDWKPRSEAEADRVARETGRSPTTSVPVVVEGAADGVQPKIDGALTSRILDRLADFKDLREFQRKTAEATDSLAGRLNPAESARFEALFAAIITKLTPSGLNSDRLFGAETDTDRATLNTAVSQHITASIKRTLTSESEPTKPGPNAFRLARQSLEAKKQTKQQERQGAKREYFFDPAQFVAFVEAYLLVRAGLSIEIDVDKIKTSPSEAKAPRDLKVKTATLKHIFMGGLTRNLKGGLWDLLLDEQFGDAAKKGTPIEGTIIDATGDAPAIPSRLTITKTSDPPKNQFTRVQFYGALLSEVRERPPRTPAFAAGRFRLIDSVVERAVDALTSTGTVDPQILPTAARYVKPDQAPGPKSIGLHLGTHGALTGPKTPDRESHHTTQYLLAEYFRHENKAGQPFPAGSPGVWMDGGKPKKLFGRTRTIDFDELADGSGRGDKMPAILIANTTHRRGKLHINSTPPDEVQAGDDPEYGGSTQGALLHRWWNAAKGPGEVEAARRRDGAPLPEVVTGSKKQGSEEYARATKPLAEPLVHAVDGTYRKMHGHMLPALSRALREHESAYYMALARRKHNKDDDEQVPTAYRMTSTLLDRAYGRARAANDEAMYAKGFHA